MENLWLDNLKKTKSNIPKTHLMIAAGKTQNSPKATWRYNDNCPTVWAMSRKSSFRIAPNFPVHLQHQPL